MHLARWIACAVLACALASLTGCEFPTQAPRSLGSTPSWTAPSFHYPRDAARPDRLVRGQVTAVDSGQKVVVLDVGWRDGVKRDWSFMVYRGEDYVGTVVVDAVFADACGARYASNMQGHPFAGDKVATQLLAP